MNSTAQTTKAGEAAAPGPTTETARVRGEVLAEKVKALLHEGNVRRIIIRNDEGHTVIEIPVTAGVVAAVVAPVLVGVAAIAALASSWEIEIERATMRTPAIERTRTSTVLASAT
jgi:hypothetical protein